MMRLLIGAFVGTSLLGFVVWSSTHDLVLTFVVYALTGFVVFTLGFIVISVVAYHPRRLKR